jgi:hypothetical protein
MSISDYVVVIYYVVCCVIGVVGMIRMLFERRKSSPGILFFNVVSTIILSPIFGLGVMIMLPIMTIAEIINYLCKVSNLQELKINWFNFRVSVYMKLIKYIN